MQMLTPAQSLNLRLLVALPSLSLRTPYQFQLFLDGKAELAIYTTHVFTFKQCHFDLTPHTIKQSP
jgi:hypothetical protein